MIGMPPDDVEPPLELSAVMNEKYRSCFAGSRVV